MRPLGTALADEGQRSMLSWTMDCLITMPTRGDKSRCAASGRRSCDSCVTYHEDMVDLARVDWVFKLRRFFGGAVRADRSRREVQSSGREERRTFGAGAGSGSSGVAMSCEAARNFAGFRCFSLPGLPTVSAKWRCVGELTTPVRPSVAIWVPAFTGVPTMRHLRTCAR